MAVAAGFLLLCAAPGRADDPKPQAAQKAPAAAPPEVIPVAEIATRAMEVSNILGTLTATFTSSAEASAINKALPEVGKQIDKELETTITVLQQQPTLATLQVQQQQWQRLQLLTTGWLNELTDRANQLQDGLNRLADLQKTWSSTRAAVQASKQPGPVLQQISNTLAAIAAAQAPLQAHRTAVLDLQSRVAREVERCETAQAQITRAEQSALAGILARDGRPIWHRRAVG